MKIAKKLIAVVLAVMTVLCMFTLTACGDTSWVAKYNGNTVPAGIYPLSVMIAYENIYTTYGAFTLEDTITNEDGTTSTVAEYLDASAKLSVENYIATKAMFEELGLSYSDEDYSEYMALYGDLYAAQSQLYKANGIGRESFNELVIVHTLRLNALTEYFAAQYVDSNSDLYMSDSDISDYFNENYFRFNYMIYYAVDENGKYLTEDSEEYKAELKYLTEITEQQLSTDKYLKYANAYKGKSIYKEGGTMDAVNRDAALADQSMGDVYEKISKLEIGASGVYTFSFYDDYYNTCYAIISAQHIKPELTGKDYVSATSEILSTVCADNLTADLDAYYDDMDVSLNNNVFKTFSAKELDFANFTSISAVN